MSLKISSLFDFNYSLIKGGELILQKGSLYFAEVRLLMGTLKREAVASLQPVFYWIFDQRFDFLLEMFVSYLKRHGLEAKPIQILSYNAKNAAWKIVPLGVGANKEDFRVNEPSDVNRYFEEFIADTGSYSENLVVVASFTGENLRKHSNTVHLTSVSPQADLLNNKLSQYELMRKHNYPHVQQMVCKDLYCLKENHDALQKRFCSYVIKFPDCSGGYLMSHIKNQDDLDQFIMEYGCYVQDKVVLVSGYQKHIMSVSGFGCVYENGDVHYFGASEQILYDEYKYAGLVYPAFLSEKQTILIKDETMRAGQLLREEGYHGFFNVDLLMLEDGCLLPVEINARFGFSLLLFGCLYQNQCFDVLLDGKECTPIQTKERIVICKLKGTFGVSIGDVPSSGDLISFYNGDVDYFEEIYCRNANYAYGSFIGIGGLRFEVNEAREVVLSRAIELYLKYV